MSTSDSGIPGRGSDERRIAELVPLYAVGQEDLPDALLSNAPNPVRIGEAVERLIEIVVPGRRAAPISSPNELPVKLGRLLADVRSLLLPEVEDALKFRTIGAAAVQGSKDDTRTRTQRDPSASESDPRVVAERFLDAIPSVRRHVVEDVRATYSGDPAAVTFAEILGAYPGVLAIAVHRVAHELYRLDVPIIPRIMSEWIHARTGIDIHPGAQIGSAFFIDHGTGIVIGETAVVGERVRIYQGATLGAKSFALDDQGRPVKHVKRHPTVESDVIIYANAVILGGDTVIGSGSVIGAGVFLMESVPAGSTVVAQRSELRVIPPKTSA